jgi:hypothetical protein
VSFVVAIPELLASAATDLASIGSMIGAAHAAAAVPTSTVLLAGGDEVSAAITALSTATPRDSRRSVPKRSHSISSSCN